ncbi:hypothetical protein Dip510_001580 [Elusimicrobium posterum]|uniref:hypothetical protein n=1 Tax=Elusimicrobium posterum TaxID=3116653 RepID=UPI003C7856A5
MLKEKVIVELKKPKCFATCMFLRFSGRARAKALKGQFCRISRVKCPPKGYDVDFPKKCPLFRIKRAYRYIPAQCDERIRPTHALLHGKICPPFPPQIIDTPEMHRCWPFPIEKTKKQKRSKK